MSAARMVQDPVNPQLIHVVAADFDLKDFSPILERLRNATFPEVNNLCISISQKPLNTFTFP